MACKAISGLFPRVNVFQKLEERKSTVYQLLLKFVGFLNRRTIQYYKQKPRVSLCTDEVM